MILYLAGPMRGYPRFNFDAFESAMLTLQELGHEVISPHKMDLDIGFDPDLSLQENGFDVEDAVRRDVEAIIRADAVVFLKGSWKSTGAKAEKAVAKWLGRPTYKLEDLCKKTRHSLQEQYATSTSPEANKPSIQPAMT